VKLSKSKLSISLVIPTFNDEGTIIEQVTTCEKILQKYCNDYEIIIADDDSSDGNRKLLTQNFKNKKKYTLLFNKKNLGITRNVMQLYFAAKKDFIFFYSADGDWDPKDVEHLIQMQIKENADIVIGKRSEKIGYTFYRHLISYFHKLLPLLVFGVDTIDPGGIKLVRRKFGQINLISTSQFFEAEILIRAKKNRAKIAWYPVVYQKIYFGSGHGGGLRSAMHSVLDILRLRLYLVKKSI
jgi:glycosyltransferase involved in cell wall biosynthesis